MGANKCVVYILTNPPFKEYVKIGYTDDTDKRLNNLIAMNVLRLVAAYH